MFEPTRQDIGAIYDANAQRIYRYIYHRLGDKSLAEDMTSEAFVRFLHARAMPDNASAFLYRIAHNLIVDYVRRHPHPEVVAEEDLGTRDHDPARAVEIEMERARLRQAIARLTPDQAQVVVLKFVEGLSNAEIAEILDKPEGAVKALQHRALVNLRGMLSGEARHELLLTLAS